MFSYRVNRGLPLVPLVRAPADEKTDVSPGRVPVERLAYLYDACKLVRFDRNGRLLIKNLCNFRPAKAFLCPDPVKNCQDLAT
jgi:hypothetical protein